VQIDKNGNVQIDQLKQFLLAQCREEMANKRLNKKDIEGFLSSFVYNTYGSTNAGTIGNVIFTDENYIGTKLNHRARANPPPPEVNGDLDLYEVNEESIHNFRVKEVL
jgi:hypothetical protein